MSIGRVKCVVWDLDGTLFDGVLLERDSQQPTVRADMVDVVGTLHGRGILNSVATRNPPGVAKRALASVDWPGPFLAPQYGWDRKSRSVRAVADALNIAVDGVAFVDDDPFERAEITAMLPEVISLSPEEVRGALDWPEFTPPVVTDDGLRRAERYQVARRRDAAAGEFPGNRDDFLRSVGTTVELWPATAGDLARLYELSVRTTRFNSRGKLVPEERLADLIDSEDHLVVCVGLSDVFGDDGMVGGVVVRKSVECWTAELIMMSCRAMGRGVSETLLAFLANAARDARVAEVRVPLRATERNLPLRVALVAAGFRAAVTDPDTPVFARPSTGPELRRPESIACGWRQ